MDETPLSEGGAEELLQRLFDHYEGRKQLAPEDLLSDALLFVFHMDELVPVLIKMCGSPEAAKEKIEAFGGLARMGRPATTTHQ